MSFDTSFTRPSADSRVADAGLQAARLKAVRLAQVAMAFVVLYGASNYLTGLRSDIGEGVFGWERAIPFVEISILPYLSIFALFGASFFVCRDREDLERHCARLLLALAISIVCYAVFPLRFDFERPEPTGAAGAVFKWLWAVDLPFNRAPSLHISVLVILWSRFASCTPMSSKLLLHVWMTAIGVSVLTTYQHHVIDVASGWVVGAVCVSAPLARWRRDTPARPGVHCDV